MSPLCRSRRELSNEYLLAKIRFDTAENELLKSFSSLQRFNFDRALASAKAAPVDEAVPDRETYEAEESVVLNQTNVDKNNNKYYRIQLLKSKHSETYYCWTHWGRVGEPGQHKPKLKGSIGEGSNHSNFSHQSSVKIRSKFCQNSVHFANKFKKLKIQDF